MIEICSRRRGQPAPPHILFEALTQPDRDPFRPWLHLLDGEVRPRVLEADAPSLVVWSSLWLDRPDAVIRFDLPYDAGRQGTDLRWTLSVEPPAPDATQVRHYRRRIGELINADLRATFDQ